jgi:glycosyltransferase involved in cell wall biosynthesis
MATVQAIRPLVSIVIPCYRQSHLLADAVESALSQTYPRVEVVVADDGSPDDVPSVIARFPSVKLVRQANRGVSAARNTGVRASRGGYLVFLDADDLLLPHAVATGVDALAERPACAFVHGTCDRRRLDGTLIGSRPPVVGDADFYLEILQRNCVRGLHSVVFRRTALEAVGGFDETRRQAADWDLYLRLLQRFPAYGHGRLVATYRRHGENTNHVRNANAMLRSSLSVLDAQREHVRGDARYAPALRAGVRWVQSLFGEALANQVREHVKARRWGPALRGALVLLRYHPLGFATHATRKMGVTLGMRRAMG